MKRKVLMWIIAAIVAVSIVGCGNSTQNATDATTSEFEEFRLKWAGNNGQVWNSLVFDDEMVCSVVSKNRYDKDTAAVFAKLIVGLFKPEAGVMLFLSNINCEDATYMTVTIDDSFKFPFDIQAKYGDFSTAPSNSTVKQLVGDAVDKFSMVMPKQNVQTLITKLKTAKKISIEIPIKGEVFKFEFETANTIE